MSRHLTTYRVPVRKEISGWMLVETDDREDVEGLAEFDDGDFIEGDEGVFYHTTGSPEEVE